MLGEPEEASEVGNPDLDIELKRCVFVSTPFGALSRLALADAEVARHLLLKAEHDTVEESHGRLRKILPQHIPGCSAGQCGGSGGSDALPLPEWVLPDGRGRSSPLTRGALRQDFVGVEPRAVLGQLEGGNFPKAVRGVHVGLA